MYDLQMPPGREVYQRASDVVVFNQLALKVEMDDVSNEAYYAWLDRMRGELGREVPGAQIAEKPDARVAPPLNVAIYYDTADLRILSTGALLRTSCNRVTHAFCAYKGRQDGGGVRRDHRHVFDGIEKRTIQEAPDSPAAVAIVRRLLARADIDHPGTFLRREHGIDPTQLSPALRLEDYRFTFFVWLDGQDALRCSIDRAHVLNLRLRPEQRRREPVSEVELAVYPRIRPEVADDPRVVSTIEALARSLCHTFGVRVTSDIKYQRGARKLGMAPGASAQLSWWG